jgi:CRP-like cAMP-binding protein
MDRQRRARRSGAAAVDTQALFEASGVVRSLRTYARGATIFRQGDAAENVFYIQSGGVKLAVLSKNGNEAVVAMLGPGDFFGEGCMAGQRVRAGGATTVAASHILFIAKQTMTQALHEHHDMSDRFIAHMLGRNIRIEEDLIDQLLNSSEKRLACTLLLLARYGTQSPPARAVPRVSEAALAKMVGTTRARA